MLSCLFDLQFSIIRNNCFNVETLRDIGCELTQKKNFTLSTIRQGIIKVPKSSYKYNRSTVKN